MTIWENSSQKLGTGQIVKISLSKNLLAILYRKLKSYLCFWDTKNSVVAASTETGPAGNESRVFKNTEFLNRTHCSSTQLYKRGRCKQKSARLYIADSGTVY